MKKVLIIEAEPGIRQIYAKIFKSLGILPQNIFKAEDALSAAAVLVSESINLIVLDVHLPTLNGIMLYDTIRQYAPHTEIVIASLCPIQEQKGLFPGADDHYDKTQGIYLLFDKLARRIESPLTVSGKVFA